MLFFAKSFFSKSRETRWPFEVVLAAVLCVLGGHAGNCFAQPTAGTTVKPSSDPKAPGIYASEAGTPPLIPLPRENRVTGLASFPREVVVTVPGKDAEDEFAASDLRRAWPSEHPPAQTPSRAYRVELLRISHPTARQVLAEEDLSFDAQLHEEGYVLVVRAHVAYVIAATPAGVFYGVQTLKQLVGNPGTGAKMALVVIRDWPAMKYRGVDDDLSRGPFPTLAFQKHQIQVIASYKANIYSPYFEHTLQYLANPLAAPPESAMSKADVAELVKFARQYHVTILPEQEAFGHLHHVLKYEQYSALAESSHGHVLAPGQPGSLDLIKSWFGEIAAEFPSEFIHIGADETFELGTGQTKVDVQKRGLGTVYAEFLSQIDQALKPLHKRLLFWGDVAFTDPLAVTKIPKDMIAVPWWYNGEKSFDRFIKPFTDAGIETWVAPGVSNWNRIYPDDNIAFKNIQGFIRDGQRLGSTGTLTTVWNDDGEGLFNQNWYGVLFGAAASWQLGESNIEAYQKAYGTLFHGDASGKIDEAQKEIMAVHALLGRAHMGDANDAAFWQDPWSKEGEEIAAKIRPVSHEVRMHAERAIMLLHEVRAEAPNLREPDALTAIELGARRIDFLALKFQLSDEIATAYATALAQQGDQTKHSETANLLDSITSMNGRCQDLRDGYSLLKNFYKKVWLSENSPYWLDNVLVRYDLRIQEWQRRGEQLEVIKDRWHSTGQLPPADQIGIPTAPTTLSPALLPVGKTDRPAWAKLHQRILDRVKQGAADLLMIGDSITNNYDKVSPPSPANENFHPVWEEFYGDRNAVNMGISGDDTANVLWRFQHGELDGLTPKVSVLLIGTNNLAHFPQLTAGDQAAGIEAVVDELHNRLPQTKILLMGILPRGGNTMWATEIPEINQLLASKYAGSNYVTFLDIGDIFRKGGPSGAIDVTLYYDPYFTPPAAALHPNAEGQRKMAAAIEPTLAKLLGDKSKANK